MEHVFVMSHIESISEMNNQSSSHSQETKSATPTKPRFERSISFSASPASRSSSYDTDFLSKLQNITMESPTLSTSVPHASSSDSALDQTNQISKSSNIVGSNSYSSSSTTSSSITTSKSEEKLKTKDELAHEVMDLLKRYRQKSVPNRGQDFEFTVPFSNQPLKFSRSFINEEDEAICDYGLPITFYLFTLRHFFFIFSSILMEQKVLIVCSNLRILSAVV